MQVARRIPNLILPKVIPSLKVRLHDFVKRSYAALRTKQFLLNRCTPDAIPCTTKLWKVIYGTPNSFNPDQSRMLSYCKFCIYTHPVNSKCTIWQCQLVHPMIVIMTGQLKNHDQPMFAIIGRTRNIYLF